MDEVAPRDAPPTRRRRYPHRGPPPPAARRKKQTQPLQPDMSWRCSALSNAALCENMASAGLISRGPALEALAACDRALFCENPPLARALPPGPRTSLGAIPKIAVPPSLPAKIVYQDAPYPIGFGATISAPHMHAAVVEALRAKLIPGARVLDVGSGTGVLVAIFAKLVCGGGGGKVVGVDHVPELVASSRDSLRACAAGDGGLAAALAAGSVEVVVGDGRLGHAPGAPWDAIHVGAAAPTLPSALVEQLAPGGLLIIPVGDEEQSLLEVSKDAQGKVSTRELFGVRYVPLTDLRHQLQ